MVPSGVKILTNCFARLAVGPRWSPSQVLNSNQTNTAPHFAMRLLYLLGMSRIILLVALLKDILSRYFKIRGRLDIHHPRCIQ